MIDRTIALYANITSPKKADKPIKTVKKVSVEEASAMIEDKVAVAAISIIILENF